MIVVYVPVRLQPVVSRVVSPTETAVVTCVRLHEWDSSNVIPEFVDLMMDIRRCSHHLHLKAIKGVVGSECDASKAPKKPTTEVTDQFSPTNNDEYLIKGTKMSI